MYNRSYENLAKSIENFDILETLTQIVVESLAKEQGILCCQPVIVRSYNATTRMATIVFPTDPTVESPAYLNKSNTTLIVGQKVQLFHKFGDIEQGWIMVES